MLVNCRFWWEWALLKFLRNLAALTALAFTATPAATQAPATEPLAREALGEALSMPEGGAREEVLRAVSRELRRRHRALGLAAARAMREDHEAASFDRGTDEATDGLQEMLQRAREEERRCAALPAPGMSPEALAQEVEHCFFTMRCDPAACPPPPPGTYERIAAHLPPGDMRMNLLVAALAAAWDEPDPSEGVRLLALVRALRPQLPTRSRRHFGRVLGAVEVDLLDGRFDRALARVRRDGSPEAFGSLAALLVRRGQVDEAAATLSALAGRHGCILPDWVADLSELGRFRDGDAPQLARLLDRLPAGGDAACPGGLRPALRAALELRAERPGPRARRRDFAC
jgi:hypothetical protein